MRHIFCTFFLLLLGISSPTFGQTIEVTQPSHVFGNITEGTKASHVFRFVNRAKSPLSIRDVRASCGCTTPEWTKKEIRPDSTGYIKVVYDSTGRPGPFSKSVVMTTTLGEDVFLGISGNVVPVSLSDKPRQGALAFEHERIELGLLRTLDTVEITYLFQNLGSKPVKVLNVWAAGNQAIGNWEKQPIFPQELSKVVIKLSNALVSKSGKFEIPVLIDTNDAEQQKKSLLIVGELEGI
ncbi:MAG: DUF1573 domain-containing protein [Rhodothermia bacterium]|nr:DUF1573 domain-containing protein [Rhodothermia bacterium]